MTTPAQPQIYHIVHVDRLPSIIADGCLWCDAETLQRDSPGTAIGMILAETALSFLGLGLRPPAMSWGVMLQQAQNIQTVALSPWLLIAAIPVVVVILAFNFMGDGLRDAADPYGV